MSRMVSLSAVGMAIMTCLTPYFTMVSSSFSLPPTIFYPFDLSSVEGNIVVDKGHHSHIGFGMAVYLFKKI